jgi:uncharacterized membrane protein YfcA
MNPRIRVRAAWALLVCSVIGWPVSALTFAQGEPPVVLGLSWLAITLTALDIVSTQDVRKQQDGES